VDTLILDLLDPEEARRPPMVMKDYSDEFKADAVALYESTPGATYKSIAADLGINRATLCASGSCGTANAAASLLARRRQLAVRPYPFLALPRVAAGGRQVRRSSSVKPCSACFCWR
jgi:hypothetical protein